MEIYIKRGCIYKARIPESEGSVQQGNRPVLVTQSDWLNMKSPTVIVAAVTSQLKRLDLPVHVLIHKRRGLPRDSMVLAEQRMTLPKANLVRYCCTLTDREMKEVERALKSSEGMYGRKSSMR